MSSTHPAQVVCSGLRLVWPDGTVGLGGPDGAPRPGDGPGDGPGNGRAAGLDLAIGPGRTGLVGRNGSGKSTLLRLITGELSPTAGNVAVGGDVAHLPQRLPLQTSRTVADLLGVSHRLAALAAIERGDTDPELFTVLADDWDVEARAARALDRVGLHLGRDALRRPVGTLSGGEAVLTGVAGVLLRGAAVSLLDEPTNNLDDRARRLLHDVVDDWPGVLIVASHDRTLLERMQRTVELRAGGARTVEGPYSEYERLIAAEQEAARRRVRAAEGDLAHERRQLVESATTLARRQRFARRAEREKRVPKIVAHARRGEAQVSAAKHRGLQQHRVEAARAALGDAEAAVRDDDRIRVDLPATVVPAGRDVLRVGGLDVRGPERIALTGPVGCGKTTLLRAVAGLADHPRPEVGRPAVPVGYLPQRLDQLDDDRSVLDAVLDVATGATPHEARADLARFLLRGAAVERPVGTLSGGERLRVALCRLLLTTPAPQLLLLDEPTNDLDLDSVGHLVDALAGFGGALLVASHDRAFLDDLAVGREWRIGPDGLPVEAVRDGA